MKRLMFLGITAMNVSVCARQESGYGVTLKKETHRLIAEIKSVGKELYNLVSSKKDAEKNEKRESLALAYVSCEQVEPVIESCDHCKDLCTKESAEQFA